MFPENRRTGRVQALVGVEGGEMVRRGRPGSLLTLGKKRRSRGDRLRVWPKDVAADRLDLGPHSLEAPLPAEVEGPVIGRAARRGRPLTGEGVASHAWDAARMTR